MFFLLFFDVMFLCPMDVVVFCVKVNEFHFVKNDVLQFWWVVTLDTLLESVHQRRTAL